MRKGFTLAEVVIVLVIVAIFGVVVSGKVSRLIVERKCAEAGYVSLNRTGYSPFCTKVQNGNTIVVHVDSLR